MLSVLCLRRVLPWNPLAGCELYQPAVASMPPPHPWHLQTTRICTPREGFRNSASWSMCSAKSAGVGLVAGAFAGDSAGDALGCGRGVGCGTFEVI